MNELRRAIPFLLLPLLLLAAGCQLLPPGFLVPATPSPGPVVEASIEPSPSPSATPFAEATPTPSPGTLPSPWPNQPVAERQTVSQLRDRRAAWEANGIDQYAWQILVSCYCPPHDWVAVTVAGDKVDRATQADGEPLPADALERQFLTVDAQFDEMIDAARRGGVVEGAFGRHGQPIVIRIDYLANVADDELSIATQRFLRPR